MKMRPKAGETWFLCKLTYSSVPNKRGGGGGGVLIFDFLNSQDRLLRSPPPPPNINCYALGNENFARNLPKTYVRFCCCEKNSLRTTHVPMPGAAIFFILNEKPNPMPGLGRLCKPITGGGGES